MGDLGRVLVILGLVAVAAGLVMMFAEKIPFLGRLPGDVVIRKKGFTLYLPIVTMLLVSVLLTILLNLFTRK